MGNTKTKDHSSVMKQQSFVKSAIPSNPERNEDRASKTQKIASQAQKISITVEQVHGGSAETPESSFVATNSVMISVSSVDVDDSIIKHPQLKINENSSNDNMSSQLSVLREFDDRKSSDDESDTECVVIPDIVADFVKPQNARKNVMSLFKVIRSLGEGMSSCVFEVKYIPDGQRYALKRLRVKFVIVIFFFVFIKKLSKFRGDFALA
ncbi:hypothetical protein RFI_22140 [Reticulomyxa filosa]|uniref:Protein kinase domain-containing protein n=1 Tax=Reticulomyxa filosa TaxID=46433 RepID=X6MQ52_RETFI|nr:hypothetical protein RFI_22140 [Reticulomyxa filosa]|eukprot:ETO15225.1 hypothetical protein RFI_22140 [Reticulomyxa filosa]